MKTTSRRTDTAIDPSSFQRSAKKFRILTASLIISGALNIGFISVSLSSLLQQNESHLSIRPLVKDRSVSEASLEHFFTPFAKLSFQELVPYLTNCDPVSDGYLKRDLALASLVAYHHFHIEKAISGVSLQRRTVRCDDALKLELFPGLTAEHFEAVIRFAYEEKWPLTTDGLYKLLKKWPEPKEESLIQAFFMTPEFHALQVLFPKVENSQLLSLVCEGSWDLFHHFAKEQEQLLDLSQERRRSFLLSYLANKSKTAAYLLLNTDFSFVAKRLEDKGIIGLISLLDEKTEMSERLCMELLRSPRSDAVWWSAVSSLYRYSGKEIPSSLDLQTAIAQILGMPPSVENPGIAAPKEKPICEEVRVAVKHHVVKDGESLWRISKMYNVKVDDLVRLNDLEKDRLYPGMTLRIP